MFNFSDLFSETAAVLAIAAIVGLLASLLRQPIVVAFIIVGVLVGPVGTGWVMGEDPLDLLAELGIALLLFVVGLKLDLHLIRNLGPVVLVIGLIQVALTALLGFGLALLLNLPLLASVYVALGLAFSSTVIIVKLLSDKREINALHGRLALGILIVQDLVVVLAIIVLTTMTGEPETIGRNVLMMALKGTAFLTGVAFLMRFMVPRLLHRLARSRELLMLTAIAWALTLAAICQALDFSKEVGAFIAGVALAATPYREAISARLTALRDFLLLFFFIDLGAHLDPAQLAGQLWTVLALSGFVLVAKPLIIATILGMAGYRKRTLGLTALTMGQISEFSLILAVVGLELGHVDPGMVNLIITVALVTIALSGYLISYAEPIYERIAFWFGLFQRRIPYREQGNNARANDVPADIILFGVGRYGYRMGLGFKQRGLNVLGIDFNPDLVRQESNLGFEAHYGDAEDSDMLNDLPLSQARWVVSSIRDNHVNLTLLHALRHYGYKGRVAMAAHRSFEAETLRKAGVDLVLQPYVDAADQAVDLVVGDDRRVLPLETAGSSGKIAVHDGDLH